MDAPPTATSQPVQKKPNSYADFLAELLEESRANRSPAVGPAENGARPNPSGPAGQPDPSSLPQNLAVLRRIFSGSDAGPDAHARNDRPPVAPAPTNQANRANRARPRPFNLEEAQREDTAAMKKLRKMNKVDPLLHLSARSARSRARNEPYYPEAEKLYLPIENGFPLYNYLQWNKRHLLQWTKMFIKNQEHLAFIEESKVNGKQFEDFLNSKKTEGLDRDLRMTLMQHLNKVRNTYQKNCS